MPRIRVTLFSLFADVTRGGQVNVARLLEGLSDDFELSVVAPEAGPLLELARRRGGRGIVQPMPGLSRFPRLSLAVRPRAWRRFHALRALLSQQPADVIYVDPVEYVPALHLALPRAGAPRLLWHAQVAFRTNRDAFALRAVDTVVSVSPSVDARLDGLSGRAERVRIENAVDHARFLPGAEPALREAGGASSEDPVILYVGALERAKGPLELLAAFQRLLVHAPKAKLWLVGALRPDFEEELRRASAELPAGSWRHWGVQQDVARFYRAADVFAFPSHAEGMPLALLEAMASGLPCVGSDALGVKVLLEEGAGLVAPVGSARELSSALLKLCQDAGERRRLGQAARQRTLERYGVERYVQCFDRLLRRLAGRS